MFRKFVVEFVSLYGFSIQITDPIAQPKPGQEQHKMPFWRSRIIALYIDWAKTFSVFRSLPYSDKVSMCPRPSFNLSAL
jgi:hypothetical protein